MTITTTSSRALSNPDERAPSAYDLDFYAWTKEQAALLRAGRLSEADLEHIAEEIEDLGQAARRALTSYIRTVIEHLMKLQASSGVEPRDGWASTIDRVRDNIEDVLETNPSLRRELPTIIARQMDRARRRVRREFERRGEDVSGLDSLTFEDSQVLGPWLPD
jgi:Domain of unknown function DUF29